MTSRLSPSTLTLASTLLAALVTAPVGAQVRASERGTVSQEVDGTVIALDYGRPQLRGRTAFPDVIKWGEVWTPGANWATTFAVNRPVRLDGHEVKAGSYSVWMVPGPKEWRVYLHAQAHRFHENRPKVADMLLAIPKAPVAAPNAEVLSFAFPEVGKTGGTLEFRWGTVSLPFRIEVAPSLAPGTMTVAQAAGYVGTYTMIMYGGESHDSTTEQVEIVLKDGRLHGVPATPDMEFAIVGSTTTKGVVFPAFLDKGEIFDVEVATPLTWKMKGGRAVQFTVAGSAAGGVWFKGVRK